MSSLTISGDTSGQITIEAPAVAGTNTQTLVAATGTLAPLISGTAQASTSGTSIDFTSIPSWVKRITVMFQGVSTSSTSPLIIQLGTGPSAFITSGYAGAVSTSVSTTFSSTGFSLTIAAVAAGLYSGQAIISSMSGNNWVSTSIMTQASVNGTQSGATSVAAGATIDRVRITTVNGTDTFDLGSINIMYE